MGNKKLQALKKDPNAIKMKKADKLKYLYGLLNAPQKNGVKFGLFPFGVEVEMGKLKITADDMMKYDKKQEVKIK